MTVGNDAGDREVTRAMTYVVVAVVRTVVDRHRETDATNVDATATIGIALVTVLVVARGRGRGRGRGRREIHPRVEKPHHRLRHTAIVVVNQRIKKETPTPTLSIDAAARPLVEEDATGP